MGGVWGGLVGSTGRRAPFALAAPSVSSPNANQDIVSWVPPNNGRSPITLYYWESNDGKSGTTETTSVVVSQEAGTSQTYRVRAENAVGLGEWSPYSVQITTTFSFAPFGAFAFSPFSFAPTSGSGSPCIPSCRPGGFCVGAGTCVY
jgi:hypothetical protein